MEKYLGIETENKRAEKIKENIKNEINNLARKIEKIQYKLLDPINSISEEDRLMWNKDIENTQLQIQELGEILNSDLGKAPEHLIPFSEN